MLGWWIVIKEGRAEGELMARGDALASWGAGLFDLHWLNALVAAGKAQKLRGGGYPNRYEARAADVLPLLDEITGHIDFMHQLFKPTLDRERIAACPPNRLLIIDVWDQS